MTGPGLPPSRWSRPGRARRAAIVLASLVLPALLCLACTDGSADDDTGEDSPQGADAEGATSPGRSSRSDLKPIIELAVTDWTGARLNVSIAEQLIERRLGYPVEAVEVVDVGRMLTDISTGDLDAVLELWPSSLDERDRALLSSDAVDRLGDLGVIGKVGWYLPRSVIQDQPALGTWRGLADPTAATLFATEETGNRGRFLGTDPGYEQHDEEIIEALDLPFEVVYSGSEAATAAEVERAITQGEPILLYWWTPTSEITRFDLVEVELPPRDAACEADIAAGEPQRCDYPDERLIKVGWPELASTAPEVQRFLAEFELTNSDQLRMIDQVENQGESVDAVAAEWIADNSDRWEAWLP